MMNDTQANVKIRDFTEVYAQMDKVSYDQLGKKQFNCQAYVY